MKEGTQVAPIPETTPVATVHEVPRLLVEWSSPWEEFRTAIRPALVRSPARLAGEARTEIFPYTGILAGWAFEALLLMAAVVLPGKLASMQPYTPPPKPKYDIIYFSGEELPQTHDAGGAQTGNTGRAGGHEGFHRTQTIRVARGDRQTDKVVDAPMLNLPKSNDPVANLLAINRVPGPPPASGLRSSLPAVPQAAPVAPPQDALNRPIQAVPSMRTPIIAPPPDVATEKLRGLPASAAGVIAPPPTVHGDVATARIPDARVSNVVPPPVSAPVNPASVTSRLSLPEATVVAPAPGRVTHDVSARPGTEAPEMGGQVIAPPPEVAGTLSSRSAMGTNGGGSEVVAPPVEVSGQISGARPSRGTGAGGTADVVPPPAQVAGNLSERTGGTWMASNSVVPPPPTVSGGSSLTGRGRGNSGAGLGGTLDSGSVAGPPKGGGGTNGDKAGVIISGRSGSKLGVPGSGGNGSIAMSPAGGDKPGLGGSGGGSGIGRGNGPGSGLEGEGTGAGKSGTGRGSETLAKGGISPFPGTGGAGAGGSGNPAAPGISVRGGNTVTLPSFGGGGSPADVPGRSRVGSNRKGPGITIEASPRSGGAFNFYGFFKSDKVYTIYLETGAGPAVLQYADPTSVKRSYAQELSAPEPMRADMPAGMAHARMVIACVLDRSGALRNLRVLEPGPAEMNSKVLAALPNWKFRPAERGDEPVEVNAILGFNIDTR